MSGQSEIANLPHALAEPEAKTVPQRPLTLTEIGAIIAENHKQITSILAGQAGQMREVLSGQNTLSGIIDDMSTKVDQLTDRVRSVEDAVAKQTNRSGELMTEVSGLKTRVQALEDAKKKDPVAVLRVPAWIVALAVALPQLIHGFKDTYEFFHR